jgi:hypothetical protein
LDNEPEKLNNQADVIDFDIEALKGEILVEDSGVYIPSDGIAKGDDALTVVEWSETRNLFFNDLARVIYIFLNSFF